MESIINGIIKVLEQTLSIDKYLIESVHSLRIQILIILFIMLLITIYCVCSSVYNSNRIKKIERIIKYGGQ